MVPDPVPGSPRSRPIFTEQFITYSAKHRYPYIRFTMADGREIKGFVVPVCYEDQLPSGEVNPDSWADVMKALEE